MFVNLKIFLSVLLYFSGLKQNISGGQFEHDFFDKKKIVALEFLIEPVFKNKKRIRAV